LRDRFPQMYLLGLTATPSYSDEKKEGWLARIFPQGFKPIISASELMAQGILAKPHPVPVDTGIVPDFDEREYKKWIKTFQEDLPIKIIEKLAKNEERNLKIAKHYVDHIRVYGKTIIFADAWYQCEAIGKFLEKQGVKNGSIYTHEDAKSGNADDRNKQRDKENDRILDLFRRNEIQVLLNVRILTEGTNIPDVKTVFITRQTTSQNLLTQMVGRALRGPKFGGKKDACLVFFIDNWRELINWADYKPLVDSIVEPDKPIGEHLPLEPISIELVRKLAEMMYHQVTNPESFRTLLPAGWYSVEYIARKANSDSAKTDEVNSDESVNDDISDGRFADSEEIETVRRLVLVFDYEIDNYKELIRFLLKSPPTIFEDEGIQFKDAESNVAAWQKTFFANAKEHFGSNLAQDIFCIGRHIAQNNEQPKFFEFKDRDLHDLEGIAKDVLDKKYNYDEADDFLTTEYNSDKRYWKVFYPSYEQFYNQYHIYIGKIRSKRKKKPDDKETGLINGTEIPQDEEPPEDVKAEVRKRDRRCLCCGSTTSKQVDHILSKHDGGSHQISNLQILCRKCNGLKKEKYIDFTATSFADSMASFKKRKIYKITPDHMPPAEMPLKALPEFDLPFDIYVGDPKEWERFLRRTINFFYQCGAVHNVTIGRKGDSFYHWRIELNAENDPRYIKPHLRNLLNRIRRIKQSMGYGYPNSITIFTPNRPEVNFTLPVK
jgi:ATP-dependent helicase IRC3